MYTASQYVLFRKILSCAFGFVAERKNDDKRLRAWHHIDVKQDWLRAVKDAYAPACLSADTPPCPLLRRPTTKSGANI